MPRIPRQVGWRYVLHTSKPPGRIVLCGSSRYSGRGGIIRSWSRTAQNRSIMQEAKATIGLVDFFQGQATPHQPRIGRAYPLNSKGTDGWVGTSDSPPQMNFDRELSLPHPFYYFDLFYSFFLFIYFSFSSFMASTISELRQHSTWQTDYFVRCRYCRCLSWLTVQDSLPSGTPVASECLILDRLERTKSVTRW